VSFIDLLSDDDTIEKQLTALFNWQYKNPPTHIGVNRWIFYCYS
jgi:hypothetical protein